MVNQSEVAQLLEQIRLSYESAQLALHGPAMVASHEFITKQMEHMHEYQTKIEDLLGSDEAIRLVVEVLQNSESKDDQ
jgi:hypothetical protein